MKLHRLLVSLLVCIAMLLSPAFACAPEFQIAIIINTTHPDLALDNFAAGNLGVIQPSWAKSYLCVAYRYLTDNPLDKSEQFTALRLWKMRLRDHCWMSLEDANSELQYEELRSKVLGKKDEQEPTTYGRFGDDEFGYVIGPDAFRVAKATLAARIKRYGLKSSQVRDWLNAQDQVFAFHPYGKQAKSVIPPPVRSTADKLQKDDRSYQIASANFYLDNFDVAAKQFQEIAQDASSPWHSLAAYMVARARSRAVIKATATSEPAENVIKYLDDLIAKTQDPGVRQDLYDLERPLEYTAVFNGSEMLNKLVPRVMQKHSPRLGGDIGDLTYTLDEGPYAAASRDLDQANAQTGSADEAKATKAEKQQRANRVDVRQYDLTDWLVTIQDETNYFYFTNEEKARAQVARAKRAEHALAQWRSKRTLPWLVAAVCTNGLRESSIADLLAAALKVPPSSPAYATASFYINDALIAQHRDRATVQKRAQQLLVRKDLPPTSRNLFRTQLMAVAHSPNEYLRNVFMESAEYALDYSCFLPSDKRKWTGYSGFTTAPPVIDIPVADDLNRNLPLSYWVQLANDKSLDHEMHGRIVRSTWVRAQLLNKPEIAASLSPAFKAAYPALSAPIDRYTAAPPGAAKQVALAALILKNFGMTPYLDPGVERHKVAVTDFDWYNSNFWLPLPMKQTKRTGEEEDYEYPSVNRPNINKSYTCVRDYERPGIRHLLSAAEQRQADAETAAILANHPSSFLGNIVFAYAAAHPDEREVPKLLYKIVRLPKWTQSSPIGSRYSRLAWSILHKHYPKSKWTEKACCYY